MDNLLHCETWIFKQTEKSERIFQFYISVNMLYVKSKQQIFKLEPTRCISRKFRIQAIFRMNEIPLRSEFIHDFSYHLSKTIQFPQYFVILLKKFSVLVLLSGHRQKKTINNAKNNNLEIIWKYCLGKFQISRKVKKKIFLFTSLATSLFFIFPTHTKFIHLLVYVYS